MYSLVLHMFHVNGCPSCLSDTAIAARQVGDDRRPKLLSKVELLMLQSGSAISCRYADDPPSKIAWLARGTHLLCP